MTTNATTTELRRCIGSTRFGIEAHDAEAGEFPAQPSQKDGLGRMCKPHWRQYTNGLRKAALARKASERGVATEVAPIESEPVPVAAPKAVGGRKGKAAKTPKPEPIRTRAPRRHPTLGPETASQGPFSLGGVRGQPVSHRWPPGSEGAARSRPRPRS